MPAELRLVFKGLIHPTWRKDGGGEVVVPNDLQGL